MVLSERGRVVQEIRGQVRGRIGLESRGRNGFGYDPSFYYPPLRRTFAELAPGGKEPRQPPGPGPEGAHPVPRGALAGRVPAAQAPGSRRRKEAGDLPRYLTWASGPTVIRSLIWAKIFSPIPLTFMMSSTRLKFPFWAR